MDNAYIFATEVLGSAAALLPPVRASRLARLLSGFRFCPATTYIDVYGPPGTRFVLAETPDGSWDAVDDTYDTLNVLAQNVPLPVAVNAIAFQIGLSDSPDYLPAHLWPAPNPADRKG